MGKLKNLMIETEEEREMFERMNTNQEASIPLEAVLEMRDYIRQLESELQFVQKRLADLENSICRRAFENEGAASTLDEMRRRYDDHFAKALGRKP